MNRRPAVTLLEVLVAMFIMAIGMLGLLVLFPLGAVSMGRALRDDRCATCASMAEQMAIASNLRHDLSVVNLFANGLPATYNGPSFPVYVDPYGVNGSLTTLGIGIPIHRVNPSYTSGNSLYVDRWFSLPNDINFLTTGTPDASSGTLDRGRRYTWAYMLRRTQAHSDQAVDLTVVVYYNRTTDVPVPESTYAVSSTLGTPTQGANYLILTGATASSFRRGMWVMDNTPISGITASIPRSDFYRIVNVEDLGGGNISLDVQPNLICDPTAPPYPTNPGNLVQHVVLMDNVAEVFPKGTSWQP